MRDNIRTRSHQFDYAELSIYNKVINLCDFICLNSSTLNEVLIPFIMGLYRILKHLPRYSSSTACVPSSNHYPGMRLPLNMYINLER